MQDQPYYIRWIVTGEYGKAVAMSHPAKARVCNRVCGCENAGPEGLSWLPAPQSIMMALRYFNAAGADPEGEIGECHVPETHAIPLVLEAAAGESQSFTIFGDDYLTADGTCIRDYVHVTDLADAHAKATRALLDGAESTTLNLGTGRGWSVHELVATVRDVTGRKIPVLVGARRSGDPPVLIADASRAHHKLAWRPKYPDLSSQVMHAWSWRQGHCKTWRRMHTQPTRTALA
jgi:UDP-glucose 4-epimerase